MYTFSQELPFKESTRLAGVLQVADLDKMKQQLLLHDAKEHSLSLSWLKEGCQFHLVGRHRNGALTWQLFHSRGVTTSLILQTSEMRSPAAYSLVVMKTNDVVRAERKFTGQRSEASAIAATDVDVTGTFQTKTTDDDWIASMFKEGAPASELDEARCSLVARAFLRDALTYISTLTILFNDKAGEKGPIITVSEMGDIEESVSEFEKKVYSRWRASTMFWSLSARANGNCFELFLLPSNDSMGLSSSEIEQRREAKLTCTASRAGVKWYNGKLPITAEEMRLLIKTSFAKMAQRSLSDSGQNQAGKTLQLATLSADEMEKQMLAQKIIAQQEQLQRQIARDLHDAVIADVTVLKRALRENADVTISREQIIQSLDSIATRLREICYDLSPSDLRDWGLQTTLEALIDQANERTSTKCSIACNYEIPELQGSIDVHIFRILQEAVNNSIKYAQATELTLSVDNENGELVFTVKDNGKGIDFTGAMKSTREGGMGMNTMQERVGLIRVYYPAQVAVRSKPGRGTVTRLSIKLPATT